MSKLLTFTALAVLAMTVSAEESKTLGAKLCSYFSRFPGCGSPKPQEDADSAQAINCAQFPSADWCVKMRASWTEEEKKAFWSKVNAQLDDFADKLEEEEESSVAFIGGAISCQQYPEAPYCVQLFKKWAAEEAAAAAAKESEDSAQMIGGAISCQQYPNTPYCVKLFKQWAAEAAEEEQEQRVGRIGLVNCVQYPDAPSCMRFKTTELLEEDEAQILGGGGAGIAPAKIGGAINCQQFPEAPFCVKARAQWEAEKAAELAKKAGGKMGAINCQQYPDTPFCINARAQWEAEKAAKDAQLGAINCQQYPDTPFCIKARAQWEAEKAAEAAGKMIGGAINCQQFPEAPFCVKARAQWEAEKAAEAAGTPAPAFIGGAISCQQYPDAPYCVQLRKKWAEEEALGQGNGFVSGVF